ncbi:MAG: hypothetical protein ABIT37_04980 [Luteolibacter sp.]
MNDQFIDGGFSNGTDALDAAWTSLANTTLTVGGFNSTGNTSNALRIDSTATFSGNGGAFTNATPLAIGESIILPFDFRITNTPGNNNAGLRFGLSSSSNTYAFTLKNWMFFGSLEAGTNNSLFYTLLANRHQAIDPEDYLAEVIKRLPPEATPEQAAALTPARIAHLPPGAT